MLQLRDFSLRPGQCPFCGPSLFVRLNRDDAGLRCVRCAASTVHLSIGLAVRAHVEDLVALDVCEFSTGGPFVAYLQRHARHLSTSEYQPDAAPGSVVNAVRSEDLQQLTYPNASFDLVTHTEVIEHVPDDARAFAHLHRVLRPGGLMLCTVPLFDQDHTLERARLHDGTLEHIHPPVYHVDPWQRSAGILAFRDYGRDILHRMAAAGFVDTRIEIPTHRIPWLQARPVIIARRGR